MKDHADALARLLAELEAGTLNRRDFLLRATALGLTVATASTLAADAVHAGEPEPQDGASGLKIVSAFGNTPKVLTSWGFKAVIPKDLLGGTVTWSGSGTFGALKDRKDATMASFTKPGSNVVKVAVSKGGKTYRAKLNVVAKDLKLYARVGSVARAAFDSHGCPACPHPGATGPAVQGTPDVFANNVRLAPVGSKGRHQHCCGPNTFEVVGGDPEVLYKGKALAVKGSPTKHCGGMGTIIKI